MQAGMAGKLGPTRPSGESSGVSREGLGCNTAERLPSLPTGGMWLRPQTHTQGRYSPPGSGTNPSRTRVFILKKLSR